MRTVLSLEPETIRPSRSEDEESRDIILENRENLLAVSIVCVPDAHSSVPRAGDASAIGEFGESSDPTLVTDPRVASGSLLFLCSRCAVRRAGDDSAVGEDGGEGIDKTLVT